MNKFFAKLDDGMYLIYAGLCVSVILTSLVQMYKHPENIGIWIFVVAFCFVYVRYAYLKIRLNISIDLDYGTYVRQDDNTYISMWQQPIFRNKRRKAQVIYKNGVYDKKWKVRKSTDHRIQYIRYIYHFD